MGCEMLDLFLREPKLRVVLTLGAGALGGSPRHQESSRLRRLAAVIPGLDRPFVLFGRLQYARRGRISC
jgi:hypothetical protein